MKKFAAILAFAVISFGLSAQMSSFPAVYELATLELENGDIYEVVRIPKDSVNHYFLHLGSMAIGGRVIAFDVDPVNRLYIPLGTTLKDAIARMEELKALLKQPKGTTMDIQASFGPFFPKEKMQTVHVTTRKLLGTSLEFVIDKDGYKRVSSISKSDFSGLLLTTKLYSKTHKKEK